LLAFGSRARVAVGASGDRGASAHGAQVQPEQVAVRHGHEGELGFNDNRRLAALSPLAPPVDHSNARDDS
jgi:hypothetical protein